MTPAPRVSRGGAWSGVVPLLLLLLVVLSGCSSLGDPSIVRTPSADWLVDNGVAYEVASLPISSEVEEISIPAGSHVLQEGDSEVSVYLVKTLAYMGHPAERVSIRDVRSLMHCAYRKTDSGVEFSTMGETSTGEGGLGVELVFVVPKRVRIREAEGLDGPRSAANVAWRGGDRTTWTRLTSQPTSPDKVPAGESSQSPSEASP